MRAFARDLRVDPGQLSKILRQKQIPSFRLARKILDSLDASRSDRESVLKSIEAAKSGRRDQEGQSKVISGRLSYDSFVKAPGLPGIAVLEALNLRRDRSDPRQIADVLKLPFLEVQTYILRLKKLGLLVSDGKGRLKKSNRLLNTKYLNFSSNALSLFHRSVFRKALDAIDTESPDDRNIHSMTMAIDKTKLPQARKMTMDFLNELSEFLESGSRKDVYQVAFSLFPLSFSEKNPSPKEAKERRMERI